MGRNLDEGADRGGGVSGLLLFPWGLLPSPVHILIGSKSLSQGGKTRGSNYFIKTEIMNNSIWGEKGTTD